MKEYIIKKQIDNTTSIIKIDYDGLSQKQKSHLGIKKHNIQSPKHLNIIKSLENIDLK